MPASRIASKLNLSQLSRTSRNCAQGRLRPRHCRWASDRYSGCLIFNALAALRAGADLAIVVSPRRAADIVAGYSPDLITIPCDSPFPDPKITLEVLDDTDSLVVGCGVIRTQKAHAALLSTIQKCGCPIVADAEALYALASKPNARRGKKLLLTPNAGEFQVLAKRPWPHSGKEQNASVRSLAKRYGSTVIVKGALDLVSDGNRVFVDTAGSPYLTKGGYGDLLAGVAGAQLAKGESPLNAARVAAHLVGRAREMRAEMFGEGTLASDALALLPSIIHEG